MLINLVFTAFDFILIVEQREGSFIKDCKKNTHTYLYFQSYHEE